MIGQISIACVCITTVYVVVKLRGNSKIFSNKKFQYLTWPIPKKILNQLHDTRKWKKIGKVSQIFVYPLLSVNNRMIIEKLNYDKNISFINNFTYKDNMFVVYDMKTNYVQTDNQLSLISINITDRYTVQFSAPNMSLLNLNIKEITKEVNLIECMGPFVEKFLVKMKFIDCGNQSATWLSTYLNKVDIGLGYIVQSSSSPKMLRPFMKELYDSYNDNIDDKVIQTPHCILPEYKLLMLSSLQQFYKIVSYDSNVQFNPNIVIDLTNPLVEDKWNWIRIGKITLKNVRPWSKVEMGVSLEQIPMEMRVKRLLLYCYVFASGEVKQDDDVYVYTLSKMDISEHILKFFRGQLSRVQTMLKTVKKNE